MMEICSKLKITSVDPVKESWKRSSNTDPWYFTRHDQAATLQTFFAVPVTSLSYTIVTSFWNQQLKLPLFEFKILRIG